MKVCTKCKVEKPFDLFAKCSKHADGLAYKCKPCSYEYLKEYRKINFQKYNNKRNETLRLQRAGIYNLAETKRQKKINAQAHREYCEQNKLTLTKVCNICGTTKTLSKFDKASRERDGFQYTCKQCNREWAKCYRVENPEKSIVGSVNRRVNMKRAYVKWANPEKIREIYLARNKLKELTGIDFHVDHIIPLKNSKVCGLHNEFNLQILTASDNLKKQNKHTHL